MQTISKTISLTALTTSIIAENDLVNTELGVVYVAMRSSHLTDAVQDELKVLSLNNT